MLNIKSTVWGLSSICFASIGPLYASETTNDAVLVKGNNTFALKLFHQLRTGEKGNLFFSPYSISTALGMTYGGARNNTAKEMAKTLRFPLGEAKLHPAFAALQTGLNKIEKKGNIKLSIANSIWPHTKYKFLDSYVSLLKKDYGVTVTPLDYSNNPDNIPRKTINKWVEDKTNDKIKELIKPGILTPLTRMVLTNAIYFKGDWAEQFDKKRTRQLPFKVSSSKSVKTDLMYRSAKFKFADLKSHQIIELPYKGDSLSMIAILPTKVDGLEDLEKELTLDNLEKWQKSMRKTKVQLFLPKFKMTSMIELSDILQKMGMKDAFGLKADFSGMDGTKNLYISAVIHKAFVDVNEEGTEAAAATAVVMDRKCEVARPPQFRADHPFLFLIKENKTGSILFIGKVANPEK